MAIEIVNFPIKHGDFPSFFRCLPEGRSISAGRDGNRIICAVLPCLWRRHRPGSRLQTFPADDANEARSWRWDEIGTLW